MTTDTNTETPACPDPHLYSFTVYKADRRTKTGWRTVEEYEQRFACEWDALMHAVSVEGDTGCRVEYRKYWVLKRNYTTPRNQYWEAWNTPHHCSPSGELYWTM